MWAVNDSIRQGEVHGYVTGLDGNAVYYWLENGTCGACLPHRLEKGYRMARPRKTAAEKANDVAKKETNTLLDAVKFCAGGFKDGGEVYASHAVIWGNYITTYDGIVMYGHKVETGMTACPHYGALLTALKAADGSAVQITQLDPSRLQVKQAGFRTVVPCIADIQQVSRTAPDTPVGMLDGRMRDALETMKSIANKNGETIMESAVFMGNGYTVACDNHMLGMYWHGLGFPDIVVPANFVEAVLRIAKPLVSFGYTPERSVTFYYDDGSFIRSQLYAEKYPEWQRAMPKDFENCQQLPDKFFDALAKIKPFVKGKSFCYMSENLFHTEQDPDTGTAVDCPGLLDSPSGIDVGRVLTLRDKITHMDIAHPDRQRFYGENFRGVIVTFVTDERLAQGTGEADEVHSSWEIAQPPPVTDEAVQAVADVFANGAQAQVFQSPQAAGEVEYASDDEQEPAPANDGFSTWSGGQ